MTDKEIIKALECCVGVENDVCTECPLFDVYDCESQIKLESYNIIKRQQEEIERFADIGKMYSEIRAEARAEAIKEFAEKLKVRMHKHAYYYGGYYDIFTEKDIDKLVKEMVGDNND